MLGFKDLFPCVHDSKDLCTSKYLSYHLLKSHYTLIPKRFKDCVHTLVHPPPFTNPHCTLTPKDRKFQRFLYKLLHTHRLLQIHTVLSHPKIQRSKDCEQGLMHLLPFTNSRSIYYFLMAGVLLFVVVPCTQMF